jgi:hypothetical protein
MKREYKTPRWRRQLAMKRRAMAKQAGACVNENERGTHGKATHGCRCAACDLTHRRSR